MKNLRGKQNNQSSNNQFIASTYRVQSDQKDIILKTLRSQHQSLKKNEQEYFKLNETYKGLQHQYKKLSDEKVNDDKEFRMRHEAAVRSIGQLKNEIDSLRGEMRNKKLQISDLQSDENALRHELDEKNIQLDNLRNDYKGCIADNQQLCAQKQNLSIAASKLKGILSQLQDEDRLLKQDNESVGHRLDDMQKYMQKLMVQQKILKEKIQIYQNQNNQLDANISDLCDNLGELELLIKKAQEEFVHLQQAVSEVGLQNQKYKTESLHVQKCIQAEIQKNNNWVKSLKNAEYTSKVRSGQVEEGQREVTALKEEKESLNQINDKLTEDLQACRAHLQNLGLINSKLVEHIQTFSTEDQQIRELINRKAKAEFCRGRVNEIQSFARTSTTQRKSLTRTGNSRREFN